MAYSSIVKPSVNFNTKLYTGNGSTQSVTGVGFQPDLTWIKSRVYSEDHQLTDVVRGVTKSLQSNLSATESTFTDGLTAFGTDGFTVGSKSDFNYNNDNLCSWNWKAGNSAGSSNSDGSVTSTVSVNTAAGFSIYKYTGTGSALSVGHGLGAVPAFIIQKEYGNNSTTSQWQIYHQILGAGERMTFERNAKSTTSSIWGGSSPTNQIINIGTSGAVNENGAYYVGYAFSELKGYSKFGSYLGNGTADMGSFIHTGFLPAFVLIKDTGNTSTWHLADNKRTGYNPDNWRLQPNDSNAEYIGTEIDSNFLSNGFQLKNTDTDTNGDGRTYIYAAFAENPFVANSGTNGVPTTAR
jgi:hypothetical protein